MKNPHVRSFLITFLAVWLGILAAGATAWGAWYWYVTPQQEAGEAVFPSLFFGALCAVIAVGIALSAVFKTDAAGEQK